MFRTQGLFSEHSVVRKHFLTMAKKATKRKVASQDEVETWANSKGRRILYRELKKGKIPPEMPWKEVFKLHKEFRVGPNDEEAERLFYSRLRGAQKTINKRNNRAAEEFRMMQEDRLLHPAPALDVNGYPRWQGSEAQAHLLVDVKEKKHLSMTKEEFHMSRTAYHSVYPLAYISRKVAQAEKTEKFLRQYRAKKGYKDTDEMIIEDSDEEVV